MTDWIANGESGSSVRAKLNSLTVPISSVSVTAPVEYLDVALPSGYSEFMLRVRGLRVSDSDMLAALVSITSGVSFYSDNLNNDTYGQFQEKHAVNIDNSYSFSTLGTLPNDSKIYIGDMGFHDQTAGYVFNSDMQLFPGDATRGFYARIDSVQLDLATGPATDVAGWSKQIVFLNPDPTAGAPGLGRIDLIRFLPAQNVDGMTFTIDAGTFQLSGLVST